MCNIFRNQLLSPHSTEKIKIKATRKNKLESAQGWIAQPATGGRGMGMLFCQHAQAVFESN